MKLGPIYQHFDPLSERAFAVYEVAQELGLPVIWHQGTTFVRDAPLEWARPMTLDAVARAFPRLPIVIAHLGHPWMEEAMATIRKHPTLFSDISALESRPWQYYNGLVAAVEYGVQDKILFGTDYPFSTVERTLAGLRGINRLVEGTPLPRVPDEVIEAIIERPTLELLGLRPVTGSADERLRHAADVLARYRFELWKYGDSIGFEGLLAASDLLGDDRWQGFVHGALKAWAGRAQRAFRELDNTAPGHALCLTYERTGDDALIEAAVGTRGVPAPARHGRRRVHRLGARAAAAAARRQAADGTRGGAAARRGPGDLRRLHALRPSVLRAPRPAHGRPRARRPRRRAGARPHPAAAGRRRRLLALLPRAHGRAVRLRLGPRPGLGAAGAARPARLPAAGTRRPRPESRPRR